jgi:hypothetical protein
VSDLDEAWAAALSEAEQRARLAGRRDVAEYLTLKNSNDLVRRAGLEWLISTFTKMAGEVNRHGASIQITREDSYRFPVGASTMVGTLLKLTSGVRTLFLEVGWPRTPSDGVVRGGGLACGNMRHLGIQQANEGLLLLKSKAGGPDWAVVRKGGQRSTLLESDLRHHFSILLDEP